MIIKDDFFAFLDERKAATMADVEVLIQDNRKDESNVLKAKANIYDIFKAIWDVSEKLGGDNFKEVFVNKVTVITSPWRKSLDIAKEHNDTNKIVIEEAKLSAVDEVLAKFASL